MAASIATSGNSTNVRRAVGLALSVWGLAVLEGWHDGVFAKLSDVEIAALALFAFVFATASYFLDRSLREMELSRAGMAAALAMSSAGVVLGTMLAREVALLFAGPVMLVLCVAAIDRTLGTAAAAKLEAERLGDRLRGDLSRARP